MFRLYNKEGITYICHAPYRIGVRPVMVLATRRVLGKSNDVFSAMELGAKGNIYRYLSFKVFRNSS